MNQNTSQFLGLVRTKYLALLLAGILMGSLSFMFVVIKEKNFRVNSEYLIVQDVKTGPQDFASVSRSVQYISKVMGEAIYSELFIDEVVKTGKMDSEHLPFNKKDRLDEWSKIIKVDRDTDLGLIRITVLDNDQQTALDISQGVQEVLTTRNFLFRGSGQDVDFRVLSGPIVEKNPTLPNVLLSIVSGFMLGSLISLGFLYRRYAGLYGSNLLESRIREIKGYEDALTPEEYQDNPGGFKK